MELAQYYFFIHIQLQTITQRHIAKKVTQQKIQIVAIYIIAVLRTIILVQLTLVLILIGLDKHKNFGSTIPVSVVNTFK